MSPGVRLVQLAVATVAVVGVLFAPVVRHVANLSFGTAVLLGALFTAPFLALRYSVELERRTTRWVWALVAVMAVDFLFLAIALIAPTGGHPSFEALGSLYLMLAKLILMPASLALLIMTMFRGEQPRIVALGFLALFGESLYIVIPPEILQSAGL